MHLTESETTDGHSEVRHLTTSELWNVCHTCIEPIPNLWLTKFSIEHLQLEMMEQDCISLQTVSGEINVSRLSFTFGLLIAWPLQSPFHTRTKFSAHSMCIGCVHSWIRFGVEPLNQSTSGGGLEAFFVYSWYIKKIIHSYSPLNSSITEDFTSSPPYTLYSTSKIQTTMVYHAGMLLTRCGRKWNLPSGLV